MATGRQKVPPRGWDRFAPELTLGEARSRRRDAKATKARRRGRATDAQGQGGVRPLVGCERIHLRGRRRNNSSAPAHRARPLVVWPRGVVVENERRVVVVRLLFRPPSL